MVKIDAYINVKKVLLEETALLRSRLTKLWKGRVLIIPTVTLGGEHELQRISLFDFLWLSVFTWPENLVETVINKNNNTHEKLIMKYENVIIGKRKVERKGEGEGGEGAVTGGVVSDIWKGRGHGHVILPRFPDSLVPVVPLPAPPPPPSLTLFTFLNHPFQLISIIVFSGINLNPKYHQFIQNNPQYYYVHTFIWQLRSCYH